MVESSIPYMYIYTFWVFTYWIHCILGLRIDPMDTPNGSFDFLARITSSPLFLKKIRPRIIIYIKQKTVSLPIEKSTAKNFVDADSEIGNQKLCRCRFRNRQRWWSRFDCTSFFFSVYTITVQDSNSSMYRQ
jgi:hypothetical protein